MGLLDINGNAIIRGSIRLPRIGVWNADLVVDTAEPISGSVEIRNVDGSFSLHGTAYREGVFQQTLSMRVIGGAGGLSVPPGGIGTSLTPKSYQGAPMRLILNDILAGCGESLSSTATTPVLATVLRRWVTLSGPGKEALARLLEPYDLAWRILPDGTLWVGEETWPAAPPTQFDVIERHYGEGRILIGSEQPWLMPGVALTISISSTQGVQYVSYVVHDISPDRIRSEVYFARTHVGAT